MFRIVMTVLAVAAVACVLMWARERWQARGKEDSEW